MAEEHRGRPHAEAVRRPLALGEPGPLVGRLHRAAAQMGELRRTPAARIRGT
ncbi:hypothetical protein [Streptomyces sp. NPDC058424]|uniref:hypothetical protein n=1 Tax=Streptomyces sp. NPDC058424 TaxID=3346491 RepID=UPI00364852C1